MSMSLIQMKKTFITTFHKTDTEFLNLIDIMMVKD